MKDKDNIIMAQANQDGISILYPNQYWAYRDKIVEFGVKCAKKRHCDIIKVLIEGRKMMAIPDKNETIYQVVYTSIKEGGGIKTLKEFGFFNYFIYTKPKENGKIKYTN